ncbi:hypothetical protein TVA88_01650 [Aeromonas hydrophila]|uniref:hypothetical protein n=1 Tax=Aeromonas hydrophila TaxID=644 RepID=UPI00311DC237
MERQTLQQQTPVYHVCQACGGDGCAACSDLCILDGDIQLDPEWNDDLPSVTPINGVIGITDDVFSTEARCASVASLFARMPYRSVHSEWNRSYLEDCGIWSGE